MLGSRIALAALRCTAILITFTFIGGFNSIGAVTGIVVGVTECCPEPATATGVDQLGGLLLLLVLSILLVAIGIERCVTIAQAGSQSRALM